MYGAAFFAPTILGQSFRARLAFLHLSCLCVKGVTFRVESGELVIARILHGGMIDQQGLLHVGDIIKEVNGKEVGNDPKVLQEMLKEASGSVVLKILPSYQEPHTPRQVSIHRRTNRTADNSNIYLIFCSVGQVTPLSALYYIESLVITEWF